VETKGCVSSVFAGGHVQHGDTHTWLRIFPPTHHDLLGLKHYVTTILGDVEPPKRWEKLGGPPNISQGPTSPTGCGPFQQGAREVGRWRLGEGPWQLGRVTEDTWVNGKTSRLKSERFDAGISAKDRVDYIHILIECHISSPWEKNDSSHLFGFTVGIPNAVLHVDHSQRLGTFLSDLTWPQCRFLLELHWDFQCLPGQREPHDGVCGGHPDGQLLWRYLGGQGWPNSQILDRH